MTYFVIGSQTVRVADNLVVVLPQDQQQPGHSPVPD